MIKYIEQEKAIKEFAIRSYHYDAEWGNKQFTLDDVTEILQSIPATDVAEVRHGEWLPDYEYAEYDCDGMTPLPKPLKFQNGWQCSLCGQCEPSETKYCPNCGAKMDGGMNDDER